DGLTYSFGVFYAEFLNYFKEGSGATAWIVSILVGVTLSSAVTIAGAILSSLCVMLSAFANSVFTLIITIGLGTGFGFGLIYLPAIVSVTVWFDKRRSLATGIAVCGSGLGTLLFAPITSALISYYGWRGAMAIIGAITLNCIPLGMMFRPVPEQPRSAVNKPMLPQNNKTLLIRSQSSENVINANGRSKDNDVSRLTLSQPALNESRTPSRRSSIMLRPDVLYQGSRKSLKASTTDIAKLRRGTIKVSEEKCPWLPCSREFKAALSKMLDFTLFVDPIFIIFAISNFLTSVGFYIPYVYVVPMSEKLGIPNPEYLISIIGAANMVGRIVLGYISDKPWVDRLLAYNICLTIAGTRFYVAGAAIALSGVILFAIPLIERWQSRGQRRETPLEQI
ncbi:putative monocarboxylate transporter, partial [Operophtera brumata]